MYGVNESNIFADERISVQSLDLLAMDGPAGKGMQSGFRPGTENAFQAVRCC